MKAFHITKWNTLYETWETRKIRALTYYAKPNKLVGEGIGLTLAQEDNVALLGTWSLIEALASTSEREHRGWLVRNGTALTAQRMAALTRVDAAYFDRALHFFTQPEVGWLELLEWPADRTTAGDSPASVLSPPADRTTAGQPPEIIPPNSARERERERDKREKGERDETGHTPAAPGLSLDSVLAWAASEVPQIPADFLKLKFVQASDRGDFVKPGWAGTKWQEKFRRFWTEDGTAWTKKQKNAARPGDAGGGRPDGWKAGDQDFWWTDSLPDVRAALQGAVRGENKKMAARLREIIAIREGKQ